jgi:hypothetical protein
MPRPQVVDGGNGLLIWRVERGDLLAWGLEDNRGLHLKRVACYEISHRASDFGELFETI